MTCSNSFHAALHRVLIAMSLIVVGTGSVDADAVAATEPTAAVSTSQAYIHALAAALGEPVVVSTLARIDGVDRQLLALRSYVRAHGQLAQRWSWDDEQIAVYLASPEHAALEAEIARVKATFGTDNPGYELWVNPQVRSLDVQLRQWNENASVAAAAAHLMAAVAELLENQEKFPPAPVPAAVDRLRTFLAGHVPDPTPTLAAPGLSPHGQMRAVDFQVHKDGQVVAGPDTRTIAAVWEAGGWAEKLDDAIRSASCAFIGPLAAPREPWHYTYTPEALAAATEDPKRTRCKSAEG